MGRGEALSAGRVVAPDRLLSEGLGRGHSAARVTGASAQHAKPAALVGQGEARPCERAGLGLFQAMAKAVVVLGLLVGPATAQTFVKPGDTGTIELPLQNEAAGVSAGKIENVTISVAVPTQYQSYFTVTGITIKNDTNLPPTSFDLGEAKTFVIAYTIGPGAPDGSFDATLTVNTPGQAVKFNPAGRDSVVSFKIDKTSPRVTVSDARGGAVLEAGPGVPPISGATNGADLSVLVRDFAPDGVTFGIGPGGIEFWQGGKLLASNSDKFVDKHAYASTDAGLSILAQLPEGSLMVKAFDQAGNETDAALVVDKTAPQIKLADSGKSIPQGGVTRDQTISISVDDRYNMTGKAAAGISGPAKLEIFAGNPAEGQNPLATNNVPYPDQHSYGQGDLGLGILGNLPEGHLFIRATDKAGNQSVFDFYVDRTAPALLVQAMDGHPIFNNKVYNTQTVSIIADDDFDGSGVVKVEISGPNGYAEHVDYPNSPVLAEPSFPLSPTGRLAEGSYQVTTYDRAGNSRSSAFTVRATPIKVRLGNLVMGEGEFYYADANGFDVGASPDGRQLIEILIFFADESGVLSLVERRSSDAGVATPASFPTDVNAGPLAEGNYLIRIKDSEGNVAATSAQLDRTPPEISATHHSPLGGMMSVGPYHDYQMTPIWLHNDRTTNPPGGIGFAFSDRGGVTHFYLGDSTLDPAVAVVDSTFDPPATQMTVNMVNASVLPDRAGYGVYVEDGIGHRSGLRFGVDSLPPSIRQMDLVGSYDPTADLMLLSARIKASDATSGISTFTAIPIPTAGNIDYPVPTTTVGQTFADYTMDVPIKFGSGSGAVEARNFVSVVDVSGLANYLNPVVTDHVLWTQRGIDLQNHPKSWFTPGAEGSGGPLHMNAGALLRRFSAPAFNCAPPPGQTCLYPRPSFCPLSISISARADNAAVPPQDSVSIGASADAKVSEQVVYTYNNRTGNYGAQPSLPIHLGPDAQLSVSVSGGDGVCYVPVGNLTYDIETVNVTAQLGMPTQILPAGQNIAVQIGDVDVNIANVVAGPNNTVAVTKASPPPPEGYRYMPGIGAVPDILIGAQYSGPLTVSLRYNPGNLTSDQQRFIRLFHYYNGNWQDITTAVDYSAHQISGVSGSASPFGLFISTAALGVDSTPPVTALNVAGVLASEPGGGSYASTRSQMTLLATDDDSGVLATYYSVNPSSMLIAAGLSAATTGSFVHYAAGNPIQLSEGPQTLAFASVDRAGNSEPLHVQRLLMDGTSPKVVFSSSGPYFTFAASDPVSNAVASGLAGIFYLVDQDPNSCAAVFTDTSAPEGTCANPNYTQPFTLAVGSHTVYYLAQDRVQNGSDLVQSSSVVVGARFALSPSTGPSGTPFTISGSSGSFGAYQGSLTRVLFGGATAPLSVWNDTAIVGAVPVLSTGAYPVTVAVGTSSYAVGSFAVVLPSATVFIDTAPPVSTLSVGDPRYISSGTVYVGALTPLALTAVDPVVNGAASGVRAISIARDGGAFSAYAGTFTLTAPDGAKALAWYATDNAGNREAVRTSTVVLDATPPSTTLLAVGGRRFPGPDGSTFYASSDTRLALQAYDPVVNGVASGLALTQWRDNGGAFQVYASSLSLAEGAHALGYQSRDDVSNLEVLRSANVWVDATPPVATAAFGSPYYQAPDGADYVTTTTPVGFSAVDPNLPSGQPGSGVDRIEVAVDGGSFTVYAASLTFAEGRHAVLYRAIDAVGNASAPKTLDVQSDATPPSTTLLAVGGRQFPGPDAASFYASADTRYGLTAVDPVVKGVASGLALTRWQDNGGAFQTFTSTFALAEGRHLLGYQSQDDVLNSEVLRSTTVLVDATAPITSLAVVGGRLFPGPDGLTFYASSDTRFALPAVDPVVNGVASGLAFTQWRDNGGAFMLYASTFALSEGAHALGFQSQDGVANVEVLRSTNACIDATPPVTMVAVGSPTYTAPDGTIYVTPAAPIEFAAADPNLPSGQPGSGVNRIEVSLDGGAYAPYTAALRLPEGRHVILYRAVDNVSNVEAARTLAVQSDATPPVSSLAIGQPQYRLPDVLLVSSRTPFAVAAVDPVASGVASGVKDTWYGWSDLAASTSSFQQFTTSFTLSGPDVNKVVGFYSRDNVLNTEVVKSSTVLLDSTPPEISLLSPAACDSGVCRVLKGKFPVLGTARDAHFAGYVLDFAPGRNATAGFVAVSTSAAAVSSGTLGTWDASALSGWQTLRLTATDLVQNAATLSINVFIGDPATLMLLGDHATFDMPTGVAAGADGKIYVADRDNDRVAVFTSTGGLAAVFGGRHDEHQDDDKVSTTTLRLHEPAGVAVDAADNVYVADTGHHRVLKLSPSGQVLLDLRGFRHPLGVAVDAAGSIYVADTGNGRVQVFTSTGVFSRQFALPALPPGAQNGEREADEKDDDGPALGRPAGIAVDAAGDVYLADLTGRRALRYDPNGSLTLTIPIPGDRPGRPGRPFGVAVSTGGECLLVSDMQSARVLKFDRNGVQNLSFGARARGDDDDARKPAGIALRKPAGLALDAAGNLYVADRNAEKIEKFGLPDGRPTLVVPPPGPAEEETARDVVSREDGGKVERKDRAAVAIPARALNDDLKVSVSTPTAEVAAASARGAKDKDLKTASPPVEFGPEGTKFAKPVTLTLPYSPDLVARQGGEQSSLKVHYWNKEKSRWEELDSKVDPVARTVAAKTAHFSLYQVFAASGASSAAAAPAAVGDPTFAFHAAYAFPNPVHSGAATIRMQPGLADSVSVRVYDVSGRKVHESSDFTLNPGLDDGNGKGVQYTYDHAWDISGVGSGVYTYVLTAKKAGQADLNKTGRLGVSK